MRIKETTIEQMWLSELDILETLYKTYQQERTQSQIGEVGSKKKTGNKVVAKAGGTKKIVKKQVFELVEPAEIIVNQTKATKVTKVSKTTK